jgi:hypothetical protein
LQSASLEPEWKTVEELATVYQVELQKVYVLYEFIGNVYSHLNQLGCRHIFLNKNPDIRPLNNLS